MPMNRRSVLALTFAWVATSRVQAQAADFVDDLVQDFRARVDRWLEPPDAEIPLYASLFESALEAAHYLPLEPQFVVLVDRCPRVQALLLLWREGPGVLRLVGAAPVSTGRPGSYDHFETPLGVFPHGPHNPDFRAEGTRNTNGIRGYGARGMRIYDLGWQYTAKGWGDHAVSQMRLQMHATDPGVLEPRLGTVQSKGCIRIPATLNHLLDRRGVLDAAYEAAARAGRSQWVLDPARVPVQGAGSLVVVVDSQRAARPAWAVPARPGTRQPAVPPRDADQPRRAGFAVTARPAPDIAW